MNIKNSRFAQDQGPADPKCGCMVCRRYSRAYLRHLHQCKEILYSRLATLHNLTYYLDLVRDARRAIFERRFADWAAALLARET